ncbi:MAG: peptidase MA family metallohydrolase [Myxococcaceae bacterium]
MLAWTMVSLLHAGSPAATAESLAAKGAWDQLLLAFGATGQSVLSEADAKRVGRALDAGCEALFSDDRILAFSLAARSAAISPTPNGLRCYVRAARATEQRGAAEEALRLGHARFPKDAWFALELGRQLFEDGLGLEARTLLSAIPSRAPEHEEAQALLTNAERAAVQSQNETQRLRETERRVQRMGEPARQPQPPGPVRNPLPATESAVERETRGMRAREGRHFRFSYFSGQRDFAQRADFEGQVSGALERARLHTERVLGYAQQEPVEVVLYSSEEFARQFGGIMGQVVAGFYAQGAIRLNGAAKLTPKNRAVLTHEYAHALIDEIAGRQAQIPAWVHEGIAQYVEWRFLGGDGPDANEQFALRAAANSKRLPSLRALEAPLIGQSDPRLMYAYAGTAVRGLYKRGPERLLAFLRALGQGDRVAAALQKHFGLDDLRLTDETRHVLTGR